MKKCFLFFWFATVFYNNDCNAQAGSLDLSFGTMGKVVTNFSDLGGRNEFAQATAIQGDGKIVVVGHDYNSNLTLVFRFNTDGNLDASFSNDGLSVCYGIYALDMAIQTDGKIVLAGHDRIARLNTNGSLDTSFDGDGKQITAGVDISTVSIQIDGKIVVAGTIRDSSLYTKSYFALARYNINGGLDSAFDGDGKLTTSIGISYDYINAMAIQPDGKIVVAGSSYNGTDRDDYALARYNTDGKLDSTFDNDGKLTTTNGSSDDDIKAVVIQPDGKIVVAGSSRTGGNMDFGLARFNTDGSLDVTFDGDGKLTTDVGSTEDYINAMAIQDDGKIIVAGYTKSGYYDFALARYNSDGSLDITFDADGIVTTTFIDGSPDFIAAMALQSNGKIFVAGSSFIGNNDDFALARYNINGSLDETFHGDGKRTIGVGGLNDVIGTMAIQTDSKIVVAGISGPDFALARYNSNGTLDASFDGDGKLTTSIGSSNDVINAMAIQPDGKIVVAGYTQDGSNSYKFALARYNTNGSLDITFDGDGKLTTAFGGWADIANSLVLMPDGKIVAAGYGNSSGSWDFTLARYNTDGSLDVTFDGDGKLTTSVGLSDAINAMAVQPDGKIVVAGSSFNYDVRRDKFALARYNTDGSLDITFGADGRVTTSIGIYDDIPYDLAIQADGKIVVVGQSRNADFYNHFAVVRYNSNGSLDTGFDGDGKLTTTFGAHPSYAYSVDTQNNGKILVAGLCVVNGRHTDFGIIRYNSNGSLDVSFDGDGKLSLDLLSESNESAFAIKHHQNRIYVAGYVITESGQDFAIAALNNDAVALSSRLLEFKGHKINEDAVLNWKTTDEINTLEFIVERSVNGSNYNSIGSLKAENTAGFHQYSFTDRKIISLGVPVVYYRLKQVDINGRFIYSRIVAISVDNKTIVHFYPNPAHNEANLVITINKPEQVQWRIIDNAGRVVQQQQWKLARGSNYLLIDVSQMKKGIYYLELSGETINYSEQFIKQ